MVDRTYLFKLVDSATRDEVAALLQLELGQVSTLTELRVGTGR